MMVADMFPNLLVGKILGAPARVKQVPPMWATSSPRPVPVLFSRQPETRQPKKTSRQPP